MQNKMQNHQLIKKDIQNLLASAQVGHLGMVNIQNNPYVIPIHFVYFNDAVYFHGLDKGEKIDNIKNHSEVCMEISEMEALILPENEKDVCHVNTAYKSAIVYGNATLIDDFNEKREALTKIIEKYTPQLNSQNILENRINATIVIKLSIKNMTGKYYK